jgi:hypothetical protein
MRLIRLLTMCYRLKLAGWLFRASTLLALLGARLYRL